MLKVLLSFLRFAMDNAPSLAPQIKALAEKWADTKGIPRNELLGPLEDDLEERVKEVDDEVDALIDKQWPKQ